MHLGFGAITDQSRAFISADIKNQENFEFLIDSLQDDFPFVQHPRSELKKILEETKEEMFTYRLRAGNLNGELKNYKVTKLITKLVLFLKFLIQHFNVN